MTRSDVLNVTSLGFHIVTNIVTKRATAPPQPIAPSHEAL
jgi:hypothetical protein